jgi:3-phosphoshikimate 1-carboxyvinyltransferase
VDAENDKLPATIHGDGPHPGAKCSVSIVESSQFASALLLCAKTGAWRIEETGQNTEESPYVIMTLKLIDAFPKQGGSFQIEPDASSGSYFWAAGWLVAVSAWMSDFLKACGDWKPEDFSDEKIFSEHVKALAEQFHSLSDWFYGAFHSADRRDERRFPVRVENWPLSGWQVDADFPQFLPLPERISREGQLGDSIMTAIILAADQWGGWAKKGPVQDIYFTHLNRLRVQETERVLALRTELTKCGAKVIERGDTLTVYPSKLHGAEIETYNDHRMAMCFAILGLKVPGIKIKNPACVKKTFPNFFQKLASPAPKGLGATILDAETERKLGVGELFAD